MDIARLDLNLLLLLDCLYETRNLSLSARRLAMSQSGASMGLSRLRTIFEDELYVRTGRGMRPTPFAECIAGPVRRVIDTINNDVLCKPAFAPSESERTFTIATPDIGILIFIPPVLNVIRRAAPHATLRCLSLPFDQLETALEDGQVDLAIGYFPDLQGQNIYCQSLFDHPFACLARRDHPRIGASVSLEEFLAADHIAVNHEGRSQEIFERRLLELGLKRRIVLQTSHFMSVPQLIGSSDMISVVPLSLGAWFADSCALRIIPPPISVPLIQLKQFWHRRVHNDVENQWLRSIVTAHLRGRDPSLAMSRNYGTMTLDSQNLPAAEMTRVELARV